MTTEQQPVRVGDIDLDLLFRDMVVLAKHQGVTAKKIIQHIFDRIWESSSHPPVVGFVVKESLDRGVDAVANHITES